MRVYILIAFVFKNYIKSDISAEQTNDYINVNNMFYR